MKAEQEREFVDYIAARSAVMGRTAHLLCGDWHRAEDLVQSVCVRLYAVWPRLKARDAVDGYVRKMLVRAYLNDRRRPWRREQSAAELPEVATSDSASGVDTRMVLLDALATLPPKQRAAVVLRYWEDYSLEDTAAALGCSVGTVKSQSSRALASLRERFVPVSAATGSAEHGGEG